MRVSKVKDLQKKLLSLRSKRARQKLRPPYDCPWCEGFTSVEVTKKKTILIFRCHECDTREIVLLIDSLDMIDHYSLVTDKWLSQRFKRPWEVPHFDVIIDPIKDRKNIHELRAITLGTFSLFAKDKGGEVMPISLEEAMKLPKDVPDRSIIDWPSVIAEIIQTGEYYSAKEVQQIFCKEQVQVFRTKSVLDKAVDEKVLSRFWSQRKYIYGRHLVE